MPHSNCLVHGADSGWARLALKVHQFFAHTAVSPQIRLRIYVVRSDSKCGVQRKGLQCASGPNRSARLAMGREPKTRAALAELVIPPEREGWPLRREEAIPRTGSDSLRRENRTVRYPV